MRNVTIFGNFTILETFTLNYVNIDKGYDDRLKVFYRLNLYIEDNNVNIFQDYYYRNINDLIDDLHEFMQQNNCKNIDADILYLQKTQIYKTITECNINIISTKLINKIRVLWRIQLKSSAILS